LVLDFVRCSLRRRRSNRTLSLEDVSHRSLMLPDWSSSEFASYPPPIFLFGRYIEIIELAARKFVIYCYEGHAGKIRAAKELWILLKIR
jgi:hypothetical protein